MTGNKKKSYNPRSRENLRQYKQPRMNEIQNAVLNKLAEVIKIDKEELEIIIPTTKIFSEEEAIRFWKYFELYATEFSAEGNLTVSDRDDIATLCKNKILEDRLLEASKKGKEIADITNALEKYKRENQQLKKQLAATRDQRYDPRAGKDFTVLDLLRYYVESKQDAFKQKMITFKEEEEKEESQGKIKTTVADMIN